MYLAYTGNTHPSGSIVVQVEYMCILYAAYESAIPAQSRSHDGV